MTPGTRVIHRRYAWIGTITAVPVLGVRTVAWQGHPYSRDEYESDLRPTPVQPKEHA